MNTQQVLVVGGAAVVGAAAGSTITYFVTRKRLERKAFAWANEQIEEVKDAYKLLRKEPPYDDPATAARAYLRRVDELQDYVDTGVEAAEQAAIDEVNEAADEFAEAVNDLQEVREAAVEAEELAEQYGTPAVERVERTNLRNIFQEAEARASRRQAEKQDEEDETYPYDEDEDADEDADSDEGGDGEENELDEVGDELRRRDPQPPFVISFDEFFDDSNDFEKVTITYYEGDDTLADERDTPIPDVEGVVGRSNLQRFGEESDSKHTVYIRNERLQTDYEVTHEDDDYATSVFGVREQREKLRVKRMRDDD